MKTKDDKLKFVMEAAGECYHDVQEIVGETMGHYFFECSECGVSDRLGNPHPTNPSPDDMNKLMELAEKLGYTRQLFEKIFCSDEDDCYLVKIKPDDYVQTYEWHLGTGETKAEALLNALFVAKGGLEDE